MDISRLVAKLNLTPEQIDEMQKMVKTNPMGLLGLVRKLNISPEVIQELMREFMRNPKQFYQAAKVFSQNRSE